MATSYTYTVNGAEFTRRQLTWFLTVAGVALFIIFGLVWWFQVWQNPVRVFWGALGNDLATSGVTRHVTETASGQSLDEYVQLGVGSTNIAEAVTTLRENGNIVKTQTIGTPTTDYTRYTAVQTTTKGTNGKPLDFHSVIGVWGKSARGQSADPLDHLFGQTLLGIVPLGNVSSAERASLIQQAQTNNVFVTDFSKVKQQTIDGQHTDVYAVQVQPAAYAALMQAFAKDESFNNVSEFNPASYKGATAIKVQFAINPSSHQLVRISYSGTAHVEDYSGYGEQPHITLPTHTISTAALQQRLTAIQ